MKISKANQLLRFVLFSNGVIDLFAALTLFFPILKLPLPGYSSYTIQFAFVSGGWGIAALTFGIGRIWASFKPEFYLMMAILGLIEGVVLSTFCLISIFFLDISLLQAILPLSVGSLFGVLYLVPLLALASLKRSNQI